MKKVFLMTAFVALMSSQAFAVNMDYNNDTHTGDSMTMNADRIDAEEPMVKTKRHVRKKTSSKTYKSKKRHTDAPAKSLHMDDSRTSRQGMPSGETNGPVYGQSDDQTYGQPMNH